MTSALQRAYTALAVTLLVAAAVAMTMKIVILGLSPSPGRDVLILCPDQPAAIPVFRADGGDVFCLAPTTAAAFDSIPADTVTP